VTIDKQTNKQTDKQTDTLTDNKGRLELSGVREPTGSIANEMSCFQNGK